MAEQDHPQIYLATPPAFDIGVFGDLLKRCLDAVEIACLRLDLAARDEDAQARAADLIRDIAHERDVAIVIAEHVGLVERLGLDGVHLRDGARSVRKTRKTLGPDRIVGAFCGASRHDGMTAGEAGADYVAFGPAVGSSLGSGATAERDIFAWWSEMIEVPVVAEEIDAATAQDLAPVVDFVCPGPAIWSTDDPVAALHAIADAVR